MTENSNLATNMFCSELAIGFAHRYKYTIKVSLACMFRCVCFETYPIVTEIHNDGLTDQYNIACVQTVQNVSM